MTGSGRQGPQESAGTRARGRRRLADLAGVGPAILADLTLLGIGSVAELGREDPKALYERLSALTGKRQDPCVLDVFSCAIAQARDPDLPPQERLWWTWSRRRKAGL